MNGNPNPSRDSDSFLVGQELDHESQLSPERATSAILWAENMPQRSNFDQRGIPPDTKLVSALPAVFRECWRRETSYEPGKWSPENPTHGQCAITALVVQDLLGGDLLRAKVNGAEHYWNRLPDSGELDLTRDQFGCAPTTTVPERVSREYVLSFSNTVRRYRKLSRSFMSVLKDLVRSEGIDGRRSTRAVSSIRTPRSQKSR